MSSPDAILILSDNLSIRTYRSSDAQPLAELANNRKIWQNMTDRFPHPYTLESSVFWIEYSTNSKNFLSTDSLSQPQDKAASEQSLVPSDYAVCLNDIPIGGCGLQFDAKASRCMTIGYWLGEPHWGKGYATLVAQAFSDWVFDTFECIARIDADAYSWNEGSQRVLTKAGFTLEGRRKFGACKDGKFGDLVMFGKIRPGFSPDIFTTDAP